MNIVFDNMNDRIGAADGVVARVALPLPLLPLPLPSGAGVCGCDEGMVGG